MSGASEALAGSVLPRFRIKMYNGNGCAATRSYKRADSSELFVCVRLFGRWQWKRLESISQKTFREHRTKIIQTVRNLSENTPKSDDECSIDISGATGSNTAHINGIFYPIPEQKKADGYMVYLRDDDSAGNSRRWLYRDKKQSWRVGNTNSMQSRATMGWLFNRRLPGNEAIDTPKPWMIPHDTWKVWDGSDNEGHFEDCSGILISQIKESDHESKYKVALQALQKDMDMMGACLAQQSNENDYLLDGCKLLFNQLSTDEKHKLLEDESIFRHIFKKKDLCSVCFSVDKVVEKCIHIDCPGSCSACRKNHADSGCPGTCGACGKKQELQCPICFDVFDEKNLNIFKCRHCVCWKCHCSSYQAKKALKKCPTCRAKIK